MRRYDRYDGCDGYARYDGYDRCQVAASTLGRILLAFSRRIDGKR
jgi:hypothetical protein